MSSPSQIPGAMFLPQFTTPGQGAQQKLTLQQMAGANTIQKQVQQENDLKLQEAHRAVSANDALSKALSAHVKLGDDGAVVTDHASIIKDLSDSGFGPEALKYDAQRRADVKSALDAEKTKLDNDKSKHDRLGALFATVQPVDWKNADQGVVDSQKSIAIAAIRQASQDALREGLIDQPRMEAIEASLKDYNPQLEASVHQLANQATEASKQLDQGIQIHQQVQNDLLFPSQLTNSQNLAAKSTQELADADTSTAAKKLANAKTATAYQEILGELPKKIADKFPAAPALSSTGQAQTDILPPEFGQSVLEVAMTPEQITQSRERAQAREENINEAKLSRQVALGKSPNATPQEKADGAIAEAALKRMDQSKLASRPNNTFIAPALPTAPGGAPNKALTLDDVPANIRAQVRQVLEYQGPNPLSSRLNPTNQAIRYWVANIDPSYNEGEYANRNKLSASFKGGKDADSNKSLNMVIGHIGTLADAAEKLDNTDFAKYNTFGNWLSRQTGDPKTAPFRIARRGVASELSTALKGGVASEAEVKGWLDEIDAADSPAALRTELATVGDLLQSRLEQQEKKYSDGMGKPPANPIISDKSQKVLSKLKGAVGGGKTVNMKAPNGQIQPVPADQVEHYKQKGAVVVP